MTASPHVMSLGWETDQYDLRTRVKVRGPLTTLKNAWTELWRTSKFHLPVGLWYDPTDSANLRVLDRGTKRLYKLRQSDRVILSSVYLGGVCGHPLGLSGDPASSSFYWVLEAPWRTTGVSTGNQVLKLRKSDNHVLARWAIPDGRWSAIKVSASFIWLTNLDTDKVHKRSKTDGSSIASYSITYGGVAQTNPSGLMIDGTTLHYFFSNGGSTARFLIADESAPRTITGVVSTAGTQLHGGEMDTTTHTECYGDSDSLGLVAKFTLKTPVTNDVAQEAIDTDLEDELGILAQIGDRIHDSHPDDAAHPFQIRRETMDIEEVTSLAQAMQVAQERLAELSKRRQVLDIGIVGNPALQKGDLISCDDPLVGITVYGRIDTLETDMSADQPYVGVAAVIPQDVTIDDDVTEASDSVDDGSIDEDGTPDTTDPGADDTPPIVGVPSYYIAPSGNDSTGDGSIASPWKTLAKFLSVAVPDDNLSCRGGRYTGTGNRRLNLADYGVTGTSGHPITIAAYPGETPIFDGEANGSTDDGVYWMIATGDFSHFVIDGITLQNFAMVQDGIITLSNQDSGGTITDWTIRNCDIQQVAPADPSAQFIYLGERFSTLLVEDTIFRGPYPGTGVTGGAGVSAYADSGPDPTDITVQRCIFLDCFTGVQFYSTGVTGSILHNSFIGCRDNIDVTHHSTITIRDNAGENGDDANIYDPDPTGTTADHNFWGQTFNPDPDFTLSGVSSGIGAASDGGDAGARQP
jgi:hypothetical protein